MINKYIQFVFNIWFGIISIWFGIVLGVFVITTIHNYEVIRHNSYQEKQMVYNDINYMKTHGYLYHYKQSYHDVPIDLSGQGYYQCKFKNVKFYNSTTERGFVINSVFYGTNSYINSKNGH